jgi:hypothetical protein
VGCPGEAPGVERRASSSGRSLRKIGARRCPHPADVICKSEVDQLPRHPIRRALGTLPIVENWTTTRPTMQTYVRYRCNGFSCLNGASR